MPSMKKVIYFLSSAILCTAGVAILGYAMSIHWTQSFMVCGPEGETLLNGSSTVLIGLFSGTERKEWCPRFTHPEVVTPIFKRLEAIAVPATALHGLVVCLLVLALVGSAGSILITLYNAFSNPYETYMGPIGLFACSGLSASAAFLALVLYLVNVFVVKVGQKIGEQVSAATLKDEEVQLLLGFYLLLPYIGLNLFAILLVYLYTHQAYTQRREQEKPTEDAPKDIMMF